MLCGVTCLLLILSLDLQTLVLQVLSAISVLRKEKPLPSAWGILLSKLPGSRTGV